MTRKAYFKRTIYYDEEFLKNMDEFEELIMKDKELEKLNFQDKKRRFSSTIRWMITKFNASRQHLNVTNESTKEKETK